MMIQESFLSFSFFFCSTGSHVTFNRVALESSYIQCGPFGASLAREVAALSKANIRICDFCWDLNSQL